MKVKPEHMLYYISFYFFFKFYPSIGPSTVKLYVRIISCLNCKRTITKVFGK